MKKADLRPFVFEALRAEPQTQFVNIKGRIKVLRQTIKVAMIVECVR